MRGQTVTGGIVLGANNNYFRDMWFDYVLSIGEHARESTEMDWSSYYESDDRCHILIFFECRWKSIWHLRPN